MPQPSGETRHEQLLGVVLHRVALEVNLGSFWKKAHVSKVAGSMSKDDIIIANLSGRGDKDVEQASKFLLDLEGGS